MVEADYRNLDIHLSHERQMKKLLLNFLMITTPVLADEPIVVHLKNHKFSPSVIKVKANKPAMIIL